MKPLRLSALAAALVLGACSAPAPTESVRLDAGPSFDGGNTIGSGNKTQDGGLTTTSTDSTSTERGGGMLGSGN
ncbi:MAG: hypothetical protein KY467_16755 [Gemmatimonadetes bacterium]|nr:hypothetical protein [Gemmatimonadota bacterium]